MLEYINLLNQDNCSLNILINKLLTCVSVSGY